MHHDSYCQDCRVFTFVHFPHPQGHTPNSAFVLFYQSYNSLRVIRPTSPRTCDYRYNSGFICIDFGLQRIAQEGCTVKLLHFEIIQNSSLHYHVTTAFTFRCIFFSLGICFFHWILSYNYIKYLHGSEVKYRKQDVCEGV